MKLPNLIPESFYVVGEIEHLTGEWDIENICEWTDSTLTKIKFLYKLMPINLFVNQIKEKISKLTKEDEDRIKNIIDLIENGETCFPIYIDGTNFVMEGLHRMIVFNRLGLKMIPTFLIYIKRRPY